MYSHQSCARAGSPLRGLNYGWTADCEREATGCSSAMERSLPRERYVGTATTPVYAFRQNPVHHVACPEPIPVTS